MAAQFVYFRCYGALLGEAILSLCNGTHSTTLLANLQYNYSALWDKLDVQFRSNLYANV